MVYKNLEIHNAVQIIETKDAVEWLRFPKDVADQLEMECSKNLCKNSTGVELRFVMKSDKVVIKLKAVSGEGVLNTFHIYYGSIQGGWEEHEINKFVDNESCEFEIKRPENIERLKEISKQFGHSFSPEVVRIIFDRGSYEIIDIKGDIEPPKPWQIPNGTIMAYGSSITHGSNAIDASHTWASVLAHNLNMDLRNLGMAGCCRMEPEIIEYIAQEGERGNWNIATIELGINVLEWEEQKINDRVYNTVYQIASRNPDKPIFVISPLYCYDDFNNGHHAEKWRNQIEKIVNKLNLQNVKYINGLDLIGDMSLISADEVHPSIYGVSQIASRMTEIIKNFKK